MPGKRMTDRQVNEYKRYRLAHSQEAAAAKAGMSVRTARRVEGAKALPSQQGPRSWRTREDPLSAVWDAEVVPLLERDALLNGVTLLEELQRRHPGQYPHAVLRTLQRRLRRWRALYGAEREVYFAQEHPPGRLGLSDFTVADDLEVMVAGEAFTHRLYQFALAHSGWRHAEVVEGGERFLALSSGLQSALWRLGGVPEEHRTDSLSAAFNNLAEQEELTKRYEALCVHYGMRASRCNPGQSHENGSIESRNGSLKVTIDQALRLRGSRRFDTRAEYAALVATVTERMNARLAKRLDVERAVLRTLPARRTAEYVEVPARVSKFGTFMVNRVLYSATSRLIGHRLMVREYAEHIEGWLGGVCVLRSLRGKKSADSRWGKMIDYRHLVEALQRKPAALARWVHRDAAFPRAVYRQTWERLAASRPEREACRTMVGLLVLAAKGHEAQLAGELEQLIEIDALPELDAITTLLAPPPTAIPSVVVKLPDLKVFDQMVGARA
ncbi:MAG: IS21 family transposase [Burkholderiaceae bacterium]|nr:IS21 family transposase [Burkholderiaceae bacterium]